MMLYGTIGLDILAAPFARELGALRGKTVTLHVNSLGGDVFEGRAIANAVKAHGKVDVVIDGICASMATVIALAGRSIRMAGNAQFMIHDPRAVAIFDAGTQQLESALAALEQTTDDMVRVYVAKTGLAEARIRDMMAAETWLTAQMALELGFVDEVVEDALPLAAIARGLHHESFSYQNRPDFLKGGAVKTKLAAFLASLIDKLATDDKPRAAILRGIAQAANLDVTRIEAIADGMLAVVPKLPELEALAKGLDADLEAIKAEAGRDFDVWAKPRQQVSGTGGQVVDIAAATNDGVRRERERVAGIERAFAAYPEHSGLRLRFISEGTSIEAATTALLEAIGQARKAAPIQPPGSAGVAEDGIDKLRAGMTFALMARGDANYRREHRHELARNEFVGMTLGEMARECLRREGREYRGDLRRVVGEAFRMAAATPPGYGSGNFPTILEDIANKFLHQGWSAAPETWRPWVAVRPMSDFKAHSFMNLSEFDDLLEVREREEFKEAGFKEAGEKATLATYGRLFSISRQAIINDDADAFTAIPTKMGRAAARKVGDLAYAVITANAAMADGVALFHANHGNLATGVKPPTTANFDALRVLMGRQTDPNSKAINIRPRYVLTPITLEGACKVVVAAESEVNTTDSSSRASRIPNSVRGLVEVISDPRLDANSTVAWYFAADPELYPTVVMGFLNGDESPYLESQDGWTIDGTSFKVRIDAVAKAIDWRGLAKNAGA